MALQRGGRRKNNYLLRPPLAVKSLLSPINRQFSFLEAVVAFPAVPAGTHGELLLQVADQLCAELGFPEAGPVAGAHSVLGVKGVMGGILTPEDETLARRMREGLARIAAALGFDGTGERARVVSVALDCAEMALRGELVSGNVGQLPQLLPSLVFLVAMPLVDRERALELSRRTTELIAEASP